MSESIDNKQFMEWVDQYVNDTIPPEAAEQLLACVKQDPERLDLLCSQLQTDRLLEIMNKQNQMNSIAEEVLNRVKGKTTSSDLKKVRRSRTFLKIAASLVILVGLGSVLMPRLSGKSDRAIEAETRSRRPLDATGVAHEVGYAHSTDVYQWTENKLDAPQLDQSSRQYGVSKESLFERSDGEQVRDEKSATPTKLAQQNSDLFALAKKTAAESVVVPVPEHIPEPQVITAANFMADSARLGTVGFSMAESDAMPIASARSPNRENYAKIVENEFKNTADKSLSTFSIDVDTASYSNIRRFLNQGALPPADAVRIEEMINYFEYDYKGPAGNDPFSTAMALTRCPWNKDHQLLRIGLQGKKIDTAERKNANLVFLLDVSGSMNSRDKLPLLKKGFEKMIRALGEQDRVAIVVYAGSSGVVLDSTSAMDKETIIAAMGRLKAGGSTAGGQGIELAYQLASDHFIKGGINRVILATDGDFNVGISSQDALQKLIEAKRNTGVFLSVLGFGTGNLQDAKMEMLANKGNGNYFYIDSEREAEKVLVKQLIANMVTIAKDVKIQVEFNPALVRAYRLIGYENRVMAARDFNDDTKDAGEIGAGHQVTALYELVPADAPAAEDGVPLKYTQPPKTNEANGSELLTLKLRYKQPEGSKSKLLTFTLDKETYQPDVMDASFRWATATAAFGMHLRSSSQIRSFSMQDMIELAKSAAEYDPDGYRKECIQLMDKAMNLKSNEPNAGGYPQWHYRN